MFDLALRMMAAHRTTLAAAVGLIALGACGDDNPLTLDGEGGDGEEVLCDVDQSLLSSSIPPNAIPALTKLTMVEANDPEAGYLFDEDRVLGVGDQRPGSGVSTPHPLWHHEIINDEIDGTWVSVTFCPLTGSGLAFDPNLTGQRLDLGVSGLLFANNLVMYDRITGDLYGPQLGVAVRCGDVGGFTSQELTLMPLQEMSWARWQELHPDTKVVSSDTGFGRNYRVYPYGSYDNINNGKLLFPMIVDKSRPIKERVLAVRVGDGGPGYPFGELAEIAEVVALNEMVGGVPTAIFFEAQRGRAALAFDARVNGQTLTFDADPAGFWTDRETGSTWTFEGTATAGPLTGEVLLTRPDAYTLFWFAWRHFQPSGTTFLN